MRVDVLHEDDSLSIAVVGPILISVWRGSATVEAIRILGRYEEELARKWNDKLAILSVIETVRTFAGFSADARAEVNRVAVAMAAKTLCLAHVYEDTGFIASIVRAILSSVKSEARLHHPTRSFATLDEGIRWTLDFARESGWEPPTVGELASEIRRLQREYGRAQKS